MTEEKGESKKEVTLEQSMERVWKMGICKEVFENGELIENLDIIITNEST